MKSARALSVVRFHETSSRVSFALTRDDVTHAAMSRSIHHQHVEQDDRRQAQDDRPDADRPKNVQRAKAPIFRECIVPNVHDAPALLVFVATLIGDEF
jgi:hypothetical protein